MIDQARDPSNTSRGGGAPKLFNLFTDLLSLFGLESLSRLALRRRQAALIMFGMLLLPMWGCTEFVHFGQISDRTAAFSINNVEISQRQPDGTWKVLGHTDGKGKIYILKKDISGGGTIRFQKPGYYTKTMPESEFLQEQNFLMQSTGGDDFGR